MNENRGEAPSTEGMVIHWARFYDLAIKVLSLGREASIRRKFLRVASLKKGERVLDVGCGTGTLILAAASEVGATGEVYGIDPAPEMIARARAKARKQGAKARFDVGVVEALGFPDRSVDVVLSTLVFHHHPR